MKAIILAAGTGQRVKSSHSQPKCLLKFDEETLLSRQIKSIENSLISELLIVTGFKHELIKKELSTINSTLNIKLAFNDNYTKGSALSFLMACNNLSIDDSAILMDADVLYHPDIFARLVNSEHSNIFLLDRHFDPGDEPVKLCVSRGKIIEFRKKIAKNINFDLIGESVGFFKFSEEILTRLHEQAKKYIDANKLDTPYEEVIRDILLSFPDSFNYEDISGLPWTEIDFPEDINKANRILNDIKNYQK